MKKFSLVLFILGIFFGLTTSSSGITYFHLNGVSNLEINPPAHITLDADLASAGNQLLIEIYLDANENEAIDATDLIMDFIYINDGIPPIGEEDEEIPGDEDEAVNAKIKMTDSILGDLPTAQYIFRGTDEDNSTAYAILIVGQLGPPSPPYIHGIVRDSSTGNPISGIYVIADDTAGVEEEGSTVTDNDGYYVIPVVPAVWRAETYDFRGRYKPDSQIVEISGTQTKEVNFNLTAYTSFIEGRVDSSGIGVPNIIIIGSLEGKKELVVNSLMANIKDKAGMLQVEGISFAFTDTNGDYSLGVEPGTYTVQIFLYPEGYVPDPSIYQGIEVLEGKRDTGYNFSLIHPNSFISGSVTCEEVGVEGATINAMSFIPLALFSMTTDADGNYLLGCVAGTYMVSGNKEGYAVTQPQWGVHLNVVVTEGQTTSGIDFVLTPTGDITTIAGYVTYQDDSPAPGVYVVAWNEEEKNSNGWEFCYSTDENGHYEFIDVVPGHWLVGVYKKSYSSNPQIQSIYLDFGEADTSVNFVLGEVGVEECIAGKELLGLYLNSSNPFNRQTAINYQIPYKSKVSIKIYDAAGKLVKKLVDEEKYPGSHTVGWDTKELPSGIYFAKLITRNYKTTKKLILIK